MQFGFGLITCQKYPGDARDFAQLYADALDLAAEAERLGFDSVWVSEHHFVDDGYMPSLLPVCAAIAARTRKITIGTGLVLAPLYEPIRLAEDAATVDLLSNGRFVLGLGLGWRPEEFEGLQVPLSERAARLRETVTVCHQAWGGGLVESRNVAVTPKPSRPGGPPIWVGALAEPAVRRAARIADGWMATRITPESYAEQVRWAREELDRTGRNRSEFTFSMHVPTFAWEEEDAWERVRDSFNFVEWKYTDMLDARARTSPSAQPPMLTPEREQMLKAQMLVGSPERVAEEISQFQAVAENDIHYIARLYWPGMDPAAQREAMACFAERVMPLLS